MQTKYLLQFQKIAYPYTYELEHPNFRDTEEK